MQAMISRGSSSSGSGHRRFPVRRCSRSAFEVLMDFAVDSRQRRLRTAPLIWRAGRKNRGRESHGRRRRRANRKYPETFPARSRRIRDQDAEQVKGATAANRHRGVNRVSKLFFAKCESRSPAEGARCRNERRADDALPEGLQSAGETARFDPDQVRSLGSCADRSDLGSWNRCSRSDSRRGRRQSVECPGCGSSITEEIRSVVSRRRVVSD